ncbi:hypothetical protein LWI29_030779 [Acer saccharum]|uniref:Uncharacterized protein n=1 Tax=Acer saccharum TaxID=4024 RepID=A0AA39W2Y4_ACESA|nr:hypothetical protein LWI29_030779 [Acer saccharum]
MLEALRAESRGREPGESKRNIQGRTFPQSPTSGTWITGKTRTDHHWEIPTATVGNGMTNHLGRESFVSDKETFWELHIDNGQAKPSIFNDPKSDRAILVNKNLGPPRWKLMVDSQPSKGTHNRVNGGKGNMSDLISGGWVGGGGGGGVRI